MRTSVRVRCSMAEGFYRILKLQKYLPILIVWTKIGNNFPNVSNGTTVVSKLGGGHPYRPEGGSSSTSNGWTRVTLILQFTVDSSEAHDPHFPRWTLEQLTSKCLTGTLTMPKTTLLVEITGSHCLLPLLRHFWPTTRFPQSHALVVVDGLELSALTQQALFVVIPRLQEKHETINYNNTYKYILFVCKMHDKTR